MAHITHVPSVVVIDRNLWVATAPADAGHSAMSTTLWYKSYTTHNTNHVCLVPKCFTHTHIYTQVVNQQHCSTTQFWVACQKWRRRRLQHQHLCYVRYKVRQHGVLVAATIRCSGVSVASSGLRTGRGIAVNKVSICT